MPIQHHTRTGSFYVRTNGTMRFAWVGCPKDCHCEGDGGTWWVDIAALFVGDWCNQWDPWPFGNEPPVIFPDVEWVSDFQVKVKVSA